jgi:hypothetical protein
MGSTLKRPPGRDKAKAAAKAAESNKRVTGGKSVAGGQSLPGGKQHHYDAIIVVVQQNIAASIRFKAQVESMMKRADMFLRMGKMEKAEALLDEVEKLEFEQETMTTPAPMSIVSTPVSSVAVDLTTTPMYDLTSSALPSLELIVVNSTEEEVDETPRPPTPTGI